MSTSHSFENPAFSGASDENLPDQKKSPYYLASPGSSHSSKMSTRSLYCAALTGIIVFALGLGLGFLIGYFAYKAPGEGTSATGNSASNSATMNGATTPSGSTRPPTTQSTRPPTSACNGVCKEELKCPQSAPITQSESSSSRGIFEMVTASEMEEVYEFMVQQGLVDQRPSSGSPSLQNTYIYSISLYLPNKDEAISHLDEGLASPGRYADVHVHRGNRNVADIMEYRVGPLGGAMTATALYNDGELPYNSRPRDGIEWDGITEQVTLAMSILRPLLMESFDGAYYPEGGMTFHPQAPPGLLPEERETRFVMALLVDGTARGRDLHPLPLTGTVRNPGTDKSQWYSYNFYYLNQGPFRTAEELLEAFQNGTIRKFAMPRGHRQTLFETTFPKQDGNKPRDMSNKAPPRTYEPAGRRYTVHDHTVKWMDWEFTVFGSQLRGPGVMNVQFKGERIVYENSLNDVGLIYASDVSSGANTVYMDATFGLGEWQNVIIGVDCPEHATLLDAAWWNMGAQRSVSAKAICIFEMDGQEAIWRRKDRFAAGLRNTYLVARFPMSVGNYDYTIDFRFYLDGRMQSTGMASGFIQASFWDQGNPHAGNDKTTDPFGYRVSEYTHGALHDHTFGFKVDLDILGKKNKFEVIHWKAGNVLDALKTQNNNITLKPPYYLYNETRFVEWETLATEAGLKLSYANPKIWTVVNEEHKNKWGVPRGYRIAPMSAYGQVVPDSHPAMGALSFTKYQCAVTKRKEDERFITGSYDQNRMANPTGSLERMLDGENIVNEDLITWVSVGFIHVPTSEDVPMTARVETGFWLKPWNYFDTTAVFDVPQYVDTMDHSITERPPAPTDCYQPVKENCYFCN
ncbi:amiloride-sensitive amine oxidase [copper-containing] isoform X2 [Lingula anatina]|nr:amiloride-sensitive amine oxidase [copper-containing] isoform X2 [Lingula anatina]|eukprot:XP_013383215.1 amiloride-sensitive amine oxidase [copper-containing] isoform X2 [Lingula anatina]